MLLRLLTARLIQLIPAVQVPLEFPPKQDTHIVKYNIDVYNTYTLHAHGVLQSDSSGVLQYLSKLVLQYCSGTLVVQYQ
jgi:hypothetical protein